MENKIITNIKSTLGIVLILCVMLTSFAACGTKSNNDSEAQGTQSVQEQNDTISSDPSSTGSNAAENTEKSGEWMSAYRSHLLYALKEIFVDAELSDGFRFGFFYLNDDDIPELWYVDGIGAHGASYVILTYRDGKVTEVQSGANNLDYFEKKGVFSFSGSGGAAIHGITFYQMTEDGCKELESFICEEMEETVYTINDEKVTEEEFNARQNAYKTKYGKSTSVGYDDGFVFNEESIKENCQ